MTAGEANEGISDFISNKVDVFSKNTITIDMFGSAKYRNYSYGGDDHIAVIHTERVPKSAVIFLTSAIHKVSNAGQFNYGRNFYAKDADALNIKLPTKDGKPDFEFMENFIAELEAERIAELEAERIAELEAYLEVTGLSDCELTEDEQKTLDEYGSLTFEEFSITDVFDIKNTKNILSRDITPNSGTVPYLCASADNNAISSYISYDKNLLDKGDCIFIGGKTFVVTYQEHDFFSNDSHNLTLTLKNNDYRSKPSQIYLSTCVRKSLNHKYSWGDSISNRKIQKDNVRLPSTNKKVDYSSMELLISAIQKIVIKDVVEYTDTKIQAHKEVIYS